ncbi:hypothetical protein B0H14DRAFT_3441353 [Mycena olivaceomarginata]|nr:hypothetical protein B0H14DRAFT_3441353 [Mycena olivaceomarginata]
MDNVASSGADASASLCPFRIPEPLIPPPCNPNEISSWLPLSYSPTAYNKRRGKAEQQPAATRVPGLPRAQGRHRDLRILWKANLGMIPALTLTIIGLPLTNGRDGCRQGMSPRPVDHLNLLRRLRDEPLTPVYGLSRKNIAGFIYRMNRPIATPIEMRFVNAVQPFYDPNTDSYFTLDYGDGYSYAYDDEQGKGQGL